MPSCPEPVFGPVAVLAAALGGGPDVGSTGAAIGAAWVGLWLLLVCGVSCGVYWLVSLPLRRRLRASCLMDILDIGLAQGLTVEQIVVSAAVQGDPVFGRSLRRVAADVRAGADLADALDRAPDVAPPPLAGILAAGQEAGRLRDVIPLCRTSLGSAFGGAHAALNFLALLPPLLYLPLLVFVPLLGARIPSLGELAQDHEMPIDRLLWWTGPAAVLWWVSAGAILLLVTAAALYVAGPRSAGILQIAGLEDRLSLLLPWTKSRILRDFSGTLAILLDAGVPEEQALATAAGATGNSRFQRGAEAAREALGRGLPLPEALERIGGGELRWRLENAGRSRARLGESLDAWHESLESRAFRAEQVAAQIVTTAFVVLNGALVGIVAMGTFHILLTMIEKAAQLW